MTQHPQNEALQKVAGGKLDPTRARFLTPGMCRIHLGNLGALHVTVINEGIYGGVYAVYDFPVAHPDSFISLVQTSGEKDYEIGIIRDLNEFPQQDADLVRQALARRYFIHTITKINDVGWQFGLVAFDVETDKGHVNFFMRWSHDRAVDYGKQGKVIIDLEGNRYLIPNIEKLSVQERDQFQRYIYW
jgi:ATP-binding cassette, subfamily B, bacterial